MGWGLALHYQHKGGNTFQPHRRGREYRWWKKRPPGTRGMPEKIGMWEMQTASTGRGQEPGQNENVDLRRDELGRPAPIGDVPPLLRHGRMTLTCRRA